MNHLVPTAGKAQLYSPVAAPAISYGDSPSKAAVSSTHSPATLSQPLTDGFG